MQGVYQFKDRSLIISALTHPSASSGHSLFEYLEFLGDRILGLSVANMLYGQSYGSIKTLASKHAKLVSRDCLLEIAKQWNIQKLLKHEIDNLSVKVLTDAVEAIIGAIYLDSNYETAEQIVQQHWQQFLNIHAIDPKMELQEFSQSKGLTATYKVIGESGADHDKTFVVEVSVGSLTRSLGKANGRGKSKHDASKNAARNLLEKMGRK